jgi:hypothetical protein
VILISELAITNGSGKAFTAPETVKHAYLARYIPLQKFQRVIPKIVVKPSNFTNAYFGFYYYYYGIPQKVSMGQRILDMDDIILHSCRDVSRRTLVWKPQK